jgi:hypothetical protein
MITRVAIKYGNKIYVGNELERHDKVILRHLNPESNAKIIPGFVTDKGVFLGRKQAAAHAFKYGQISEPSDCLISEDLW